MNIIRSKDSSLSELRYLFKMKFKEEKLRSDITSVGETENTTATSLNSSGLDCATLIQYSKIFELHFIRFTSFEKSNSC